MRKLIRFVFWVILLILNALILFSERLGLDTDTTFYLDGVTLIMLLMGCLCNRTLRRERKEEE